MIKNSTTKLELKNHQAKKNEFKVLFPKILGPETEEIKSGKTEEASTAEVEEELECPKKL